MQRLSNTTLHASGNIGVTSFKILVANSNTSTIWTPIFERFEVRCVHLRTDTKKTSVVQRLDYTLRIC